MTETAWTRGRFDASPRPQRVLFGRMYEDAAIETAAFRPGGRVFCIASAGCTAIELASTHDVTAVDVNPVQLEYVAHRLAGGPAGPGSAERLLAAVRFFAPLVGWSTALRERFLALDDPPRQVAFWREHLDTARFRRALALVLSKAVLRMAYAPALLDVLPAGFAAVLRARMARTFARHPNRANPYARALLLGREPAGPPRRTPAGVRLVHADAAGFLERIAPQSFDGLTFSNILDGATKAYAARLGAAVQHAAAPGAVVVLRSFREPADRMAAEQAARDRSFLWGSIFVGSADDPRWIACARSE